MFFKGCFSSYILVGMYLKLVGILTAEVSPLAMRPLEGVSHQYKPSLPPPRMLVQAAPAHNSCPFIDSLLVRSSWSLQSPWETDIKLIIKQILFNYSCYKCFKGKSTETMGADNQGGWGKGGFPEERSFKQPRKGWVKRL